MFQLKKVSPTRRFYLEVENSPLGLHRRSLRIHLEFIPCASALKPKSFKNTSRKSALEIVGRRPTPPIHRQFISKTKSENCVTVEYVTLFFPKLVNTVPQIVALTRQHPQIQIQPIPMRVYSR